MSEATRETAYRKLALKNQKPLSQEGDYSLCAVLTLKPENGAMLLNSLLNQTVLPNQSVIIDLSEDKKLTKQLRKLAKNDCRFTVMNTVDETELAVIFATNRGMIANVTDVLEDDELYNLLNAAVLHPDFEVFSSKHATMFASTFANDAIAAISGKRQFNGNVYSLAERPANREYTALAQKNRTESKICAGMVIYNASLELSGANIDNILPQVDHIYIADNGSDNLNQFIRRFGQNPKVTFIRIGSNKGIAFALNRILEYSDKNGYDWVLTLDQDTVCDAEMINIYSRYIHAEKVGIVSPYIIHRGKTTPADYLLRHKPEAELLQSFDRCITSASLTNVKAAKAVGGFNDELFIDAVDFDLNIRLLASGYAILRANDTYIVQEIGERVEVKLYNLFYRFIGDGQYHGPKYFSVHSDFRLYYIARNYKWFLKKYKTKSLTVSRTANAKDMLLRLLLYPKGRSRFKMLHTICKGKRDARKMTY